MNNEIIKFQSFGSDLFTESVMEEKQPKGLPERYKKHRRTVSHDLYQNPDFRRYIKQIYPFVIPDSYTRTCSGCSGFLRRGDTEHSPNKSVKLVWRGGCTLVACNNFEILSSRRLHLRSSNTSHL